MKKLIGVLGIFALMLEGCNTGGSSSELKFENNVDPVFLEMIRSFPLDKLDLVEPRVTKTDIDHTLGAPYSSDNWILTSVRKDWDEIELKQTANPSHGVLFRGYKTSADTRIIAVQQAYEGKYKTDFFECNNATGAAGERWKHHPMMDIKLAEFFDETVQLPSEYADETLEPFIYISFWPRWIAVTVNKWEYTQDVAAKNVKAPGARSVKYSYNFDWIDSTSSFKSHKLQDPGFNKEN